MLSVSCAIKSRNPGKKKDDETKWKMLQHKNNVNIDLINKHKISLNYLLVSCSPKMIITDYHHYNL